MRGLADGLADARKLTYPVPPPSLDEMATAGIDVADHAHALAATTPTEPGPPVAGTVPFNDRNAAQVIR
jgi:hypothetical protein